MRILFDLLTGAELYRTDSLLPADFQPPYRIVFQLHTFVELIVAEADAEVQALNRPGVQPAPLGASFAMKKVDTEIYLFVLQKLNIVFLLIQVSKVLQLDMHYQLEK